MKIEDILSRFEGVEQTAPDNWMARCPAHGDANPSLSITRKPDGKVLMHCFAGCTVEEICAAVGLKTSDLMPPSAKATEGKPGGKKKKSLGRFVCDYVYQDEDGTALYKIARYEQEGGLKTFVHLRPDPDNRYGWSYGIHDKKTGKLLIKYRCPFRLPRVVQAAKSGKVVFILEGEKDVLNFEAATGCAATCNSGGALKWGEDFPDDWIKWFEGAKGVVVIADNDPEYKTVVRKFRGQVTTKEMPHWKGQKHAADVRAKLVKAGFPAEKIKLMVMPGVEVEQGVTKRVKDFSDWAEARKAAGLASDKAAFQEAYKAAEPWPEKWNFSEDELSHALADFASAEKRSARQTSLEGPAAAAPSQEKGDGAQTLSDTERLGGRFGRLVPRTPGMERDKYVVGFELGGGEVLPVTFDVGMTVGEIFGLMYTEALPRVPGESAQRAMRARAKAWAATLWLLTRGRFFWLEGKRDVATAMYLDSNPKTCRLMRIDSDEFRAFVGRAALMSSIDKKRGEMAAALGLIEQVALDTGDEGYSTGVKPSVGWDRRGDRLYISSGDAMMCRIADGKAEMVQNGTDGVVFMRGQTLDPWKLKDGDGTDPFADSLIFGQASYAEAHGAMNLKHWVCNLFACHRTKPILLITGGKGSGKTRMATAIKELLSLRTDGELDVAVNNIEENEKGADSFWNTINAGKVEVFDNFDTKIKWVSNALQTSSTGGKTKRRELYKTYGTAILAPNASIILTSNNPDWAKEGKTGLADRLIIMRLVETRRKSQERAISSQIEIMRDDYMTWIVRALAKAMSDTGDVSASVNQRHPDYGEFSVRLGRAFGDEAGALAALTVAEADKSLLPLSQPGITREIFKVLREKNWRWQGGGEDMARLIIAAQEEPEDAELPKKYNAKNVGWAFRNSKSQFETLLKMAVKDSHGHQKVYSFDGLTDFGLAVVGLVDFALGFTESVCAGDASGFSGNAHKNPPNPPCAGEDSSSFPVKEEKEEDNATLDENSGGLDDEGFDF